MKDQANNVLKSIQQFWKSQSKKQHITYLSIIGGIVVIAIILAIAMNKPSDYTVLYTNLESTEASEILTEIQSMKIDATVKSDGTILVPADQEDSLRMQLGVKGYPKSGFSYDIWDKNVNMFTTDSQTREIVKMGLQNNLQATIESLDGIESATVILDIPVASSTVLSTNTKKATASVTVHLMPGVSLSSGQVKGISHIVMMSISGLTEDNISIVDGEMNLLSAKEDTENSSQIDIERLKFKNDFEQIISDKIFSLLTPSYGENGVNVSVNAVFDYDKKVTEGTTYTPSVGDNGMIEHQDESSSSSSDVDSGGTVGVEPNADGTYPTTDGTSGGTSWQESSKSTDYLVNTLKEQTEKNGYYVDRVNVSVTVYSNDLSETDQSKIKNIVVNAAGTTPEFVSVENLPLFDDKDPGENTGTDPEEPLYFGYTLNQLILAAGIAFVLIIILIVVFIIATRKSRKKKKLAKKKKLLMEQNGANVLIGEDGEPILPVDIKKLSEKPPETKEAAIRREIGEFAHSSPEIAAQLLKSWIREDGV